MYNPSLSGGSGNSAANNRLFIYEVIGLSNRGSADSVNGNVRRSGSEFITVPYQRMNQELRRIANLGGKILSIRPFGANSQPMAIECSETATQTEPQAIESSETATQTEPQAAAPAATPKKTCGCPGEYLPSERTVCW